MFYICSMFKHQSKNNMKNMRNFLVLGTLIFAVACNQAPEANVQAEEAKEVDASKTAEAASYAVLTDADEINWRGYKTVTGDSHTGTLQISEGSFEVKDGAVVGASFTIDMNSIVNSDVESDEYRAKLEGHLKSPDFFAVDSFPTATFVITEVTPIEAVEGSETTHDITGNLTLRGITKSITIGAKISVDDNNVSFNAPDVVIDRSQWNVKFRSTSFAAFADIAKEEVISNSLELKINVQAAKS